MTKDFEIKTTFSAIDRVSQVVSKIRSRISRFAAVNSMSLRRLDHVLSGISKKLISISKKGAKAAVGGLVAIGGAVGLVMKQFSKVEDAEAAFTPLLGGAKRAKEMVAALNETAATTPFQFETLADNAKLFLPAVNGDINETIRVTRMLGDATGGNSEKFKSASVAMAKMMMKGKASAETLTSLVIAGIPVYGELSKHLGVSADELESMSRKGKISSDIMLSMFKKMTSEGGIFYKGMEVASVTLTGKISTLKDNVGLAAAELGDALAPTLKELTDEAIKVAEKIREWVSQNKELIRTKVTEFVKKIPHYLELIAKWVPRIAKFVGIFYGIAAAVKVLRGAMWLLNKATVSTAISMAEVGTNGTSAIDKATGATEKATGAAGKLQGALALVGTAVAAWEVGTIIYEDLVAPLIEAQDKLDKLTEDVSDTMGRYKSKRGTAQLNKDMAKINELEKNMDTGFSGIAKNWLPDITGAFGMFENMAKQSIKKEKGDIRSELEQRAIGAEFSTTGTGPMSIMEPTSTQSKTEQVVKHQVEMTINDAGGKTKIKSGKTGPGFTLKHTGVAI